MPVAGHWCSGTKCEHGLVLHWSQAEKAKNPFLDSHPTSCSKRPNVSFCLWSLQVDLPSGVLRSMSELLDLDANDAAFNSSVAAVTEKHARYKKYIDRVCDDIRELKITKKQPVLFVYSVKDEFYRIFF